MTIDIPRRWVSIAVIVLAAGLITACGGPPPPSSWPGLFVDGQTAYLASTDRIYAIDTNSDTNNLQRQKWTFPPADQNAPVTFHGEPFVTDSGVLYASGDSVTGRGALFALDTHQTVDAGQPPNTAITVAAKWTYPASENALPLGSVFGGVAYDGASVYAGTNDGFVISVDTETGRLNWTFPETGATPIGRVWSSPVVSGSIVYVASQDHNLYALDTANGSRIWSFAAGGVLAGTPTVYGDALYAGSFDQKLYALDAATGAKKWEFIAQGWLWDSPTVFDDILYFGDLSGNLYAVQSNGSELWRKTGLLEGMIRARPLVTQDRIYVATRAHKLYALNRDSQAIEWTFSALQDGESFLTTPALVGDSLFVAPLPAGGTPVRLYAVNARSGNLQWQFPPPAQ